MKQTVLQNNLQNLLESAENILLLQGPVGNFFLRLADWLTANGKTVHKFNFNAGDVAEPVSSGREQGAYNECGCGEVVDDNNI